MDVGISISQWTEGDVHVLGYGWKEMCMYWDEVGVGERYVGRVKSKSTLSKRDPETIQN